MRRPKKEYGRDVIVLQEYAPNTEKGKDIIGYLEKNNYNPFNGYH
jgi:hypothetical protein